MRTGRVFYLLGQMTVVVGLAMLLPLLCALAYRGPDIMAFAVSAPLTIACGLLMAFACRKHRRGVMRQRDSFFFVTMTWVLATLFGSLPYLLAGSFHDMASAVFETMSGFTTTGASAMPDIEIMPHGVLLWRALTHWLGGAGIVLLFVALIQRGGNSGEGANLFKSEFSGGALAERVATRIEDNAAAIFSVYLALTVACTLALCLAGMDFFDAVCHSLATVSTGGFSTKNLSVGYFNNPAAEWVIAVFLFLSSINLALYYLLFVRRRVRKVFADQELRVLCGVMVVATVLVTVSIARGFYAEQSVGFSLRHAFFQVASIMSTGGFATVDFDQWPGLARIVLIILLFIGGCAGSTAGAIKVNRWYLATVTAVNELKGAIRPRAVRKVYYNGRVVSDDILRSLTVYFYMYLVLIFAGGLVLCMLGMDWLEAFVGALASIGNVGPAIGSLGPAGNFSAVPPLGKYVLSFLMLAGRLELYTVLALFVPDFWKK